jgi:glycerophosphoryl diester phosphodiesterase
MKNAKSTLALAVAAAASLGACGGSDNNNNNGQAPLPTLDGNVAAVIGHRGLPGLYPEETCT